MICRFADLFAVCYLWVVCKEDKCCVVTQRVADICVTWLVYVCTYCVPIATLNQRKLIQLRPNNYNVLKPWILILFNGLSVVLMDFLFRYTRRSPCFSFWPFCYLVWKLGKISLVHWNHSKLFSTPSPFLRGTVNDDLKTFQKYWKFPYSSLQTDSQVKRAEKENRLASIVKH